MENTEFTPGVRAALVSVVTRDRTEEEAKASLEELRRLLETAGGEAVFVMMQNKETPDVRTYLGSGKAAELCYYCATNEADLAVFDCELSPPIRGKIFAYGREKEIILYQGDIRYISAKHDDIPAIKNRGGKVFDIPETVKVDFAGENRLALERFIYNGDAVAKVDNTPAISFPFDTTCEVAGAKLYMPIEATDKCTSIKLDGADLVGEKCMVFDDPYMCYQLPTISVGTHSLDIERTGAFNH